MCLVHSILQMARHESKLADKQRQRRGISLYEAGYRPATLHRYRSALFAFARWWESQDVVELLDDSVEEFDVSVSYYLSFLWEAGHGRSRAATLLSGIVLYLPRLRGKLAVCTRLLKNWSKAEPSVPYPPMTRDVAAAVAIHLAADGKPDSGVAVLLGFAGFLRISEIVGLCCSDVADAKDTRTNMSSMVLRLASTKTGTEQSVVIRDEQVQRLVRYHLRSRPARGPLFSFSAAQFRSAFKQTCVKLGLSSSFTPHSLRHGAATHAFLSGMPVESIMSMGRWKQSTSAAHYIQSGRALLLKMVIPDNVSELGVEVWQDVVGCFERVRSAKQ